MSLLLKTLVQIILPTRNCGWCGRSILSTEYFTKAQQNDSKGLKAYLVV